MANRKYCYDKVIQVVMISFAVVFGLLVFFSEYTCCVVTK